MVKQFLAMGLLFAVGIGIGAFFTPVGVDWHKELVDPEAEIPVHQKQQSNSEAKRFFS